jgi:hypothetical protein
MRAVAATQRFGHGGRSEGERPCRSSWPARRAREAARQPEKLERLREVRGLEAKRDQAREGLRPGQPRAGSQEGSAPGRNRAQAGAAGRADIVFTVRWQLA